jgi:hypothetical protein
MGRRRLSPEWPLTKETTTGPHAKGTPREYYRTEIYTHSHCRHKIEAAANGPTKAHSQMEARAAIAREVRKHASHKPRDAKRNE